MWGQKFGYVFKNSLKYPFKRFGDVKGLYFLTGVAVGVLYMFNIPMQVHLGQIQEQHMPMDATAISFIVLTFITSILVMLVILPFSVAVIRNVVGDEKAEANLFGAIFAKRQMLYLWAAIKAFFVSLLPVVIGLLIFMLMKMSSTPENVDFINTLSVFLVIISAFLTFFLMLRVFFAVVFAALDKGTSLRDSWELTKGSWWLIFLTYLCVSLVIVLGVLVIMIPAAFIIAPIMMLLGPLALYIGAFLYGLIYPFFLMFSLAIMGNLYLVMKNKDKVVEEGEKLISK